VTPGTIARGALTVALLIGPAGCGAREERPGPSHAADRLIESAATPEERQQLTRLRDEIDDVARKRLAEIDAEIARLEKENAELRKSKRKTR